MNANQLIRQLRKEKNMTLDDLAKITGFTKGYLSKIERSDKQPPFSTLQTISEALGISFQTLLSIQEPVTLENTWHSSNVSTSFVHKTKLLLTDYRTRHMAPFTLSIGRGETETLIHTEEEFVYVLSGECQIKVNGEIFHMSAGDSYYISSNMPHSYINSSNNLCVTLNVKCDISSRSRSLME